MTDPAVTSRSHSTVPNDSTTGSPSTRQVAVRAVTYAVGPSTRSTGVSRWAERTQPGYPRASPEERCHGATTRDQSPADSRTSTGSPISSWVSVRPCRPSRTCWSIESAQAGGVGPVAHGGLVEVAWRVGGRPDGGDRHGHLERLVHARSSIPSPGASGSTTVAPS